MKKGWLSEIFDSIQGEGIYAGVRQIFIRFAGCNIHCDYCDTKRAWQKQKYCRVKIIPLSPFINADSRIRHPASKHREGGIRGIKLLKNPMTVPELIGAIKSITNSPIHSVSLTGGEPLLQIDFLKELIPQLRRLGLKTYLETNGTLPGALKKIADEVDFIAMDIKLPTATWQEFWKEHKEFLKLANRKRGCVPVFVKVVVTPRTSEKEIEKVSRLIAKVNRGIPLVLQPASQKGTVPGQSLFYYQEIAARILKDVRIIPQLHKIINLP